MSTPLPRHRFIEQVVWAAWRHMGQGVFNDYGRLLAEEQFDGIIALTGKL